MNMASTMEGEHAVAGVTATRILVVDDNALNCELMDAILSPHGYAVEHALSGERALEMCEEFRPHLVLLDVSMPDMDGFEVARELRARETTRLVPLSRICSLDVDAMMRKMPHFFRSTEASGLEFRTWFSFQGSGAGDWVLHVQDGRAEVRTGSDPQADLVVSVERAGNPFLRDLIRACGYLRNDAGPEVVSECAERIRAGRSLIIFPEGTRSPRRGLRRLQRGAAHIALQVPCDLLPVLIRSDPPAFGKGQKWYDLPDRAIRMALVVGEPIAAKSVLGENVPPPVAARRLTAQLRESFEKGLDIVDVGIA